MDEDKWDERYLKMAKLVASWSKDDAKVGAVVVRNNRVVATGFNGFPSEVLDEKQRRENDDTKLQMTVHAEENALIVAGRSAEGATIYVHGKPVCPRCAGSIIQAGVLRVVAATPRENSESKWDKWGVISRSMFAESGVKFHGKSLRIRQDSEYAQKKSDQGVVSPGNGSSIVSASAPGSVPTVTPKSALALNAISRVIEANPPTKRRTGAAKRSAAIERV
jgi:dCMP deaminase